MLRERRIGHDRMSDMPGASGWDSSSAASVENLSFIPASRTSVATIAHKGDMVTITDDLIERGSQRFATYWKHLHSEVVVNRHELSRDLQASES